MKNIILVAHNVRSCHNVGSLLRTAEGLGIKTVYLSGYTPYPSAKDDRRLPHVQIDQTRRIHKTALGAENTQAWQHIEDIYELQANLKKQGYQIVGLEQTAMSKLLPKFKSSDNVALVVGSEVGGLTDDVLRLCDEKVEIPMHGSKESYNVAVASAIALYHLRFSG